VSFQAQDHNFDHLDESITDDTFNPVRNQTTGDNQSDVDQGAVKPPAIPLAWTGFAGPPLGTTGPVLTQSMPAVQNATVQNVTVPQDPQGGLPIHSGIHGVLVALGQRLTDDNRLSLE
jgi:hypothetical protein